MNIGQFTKFNQIQLKLLWNGGVPGAYSKIQNQMYFSDLHFDFSYLTFLLKVVFLDAWLFYRNNEIVHIRIYYIFDYKTEWILINMIMFKNGHSLGTLPRGLSIAHWCRFRGLKWTHRYRCADRWRDWHWCTSWRSRGHWLPTTKKCFQRSVPSGRNILTFLNFCYFCTCAEFSNQLKCVAHSVSDFQVSP